MSTLAHCEAAILPHRFGVKQIRQSGGFAVRIGHDKVTNPVLKKQVMAASNVTINRAPVLTLWASVVAERMGYEHATALTLGKCVAGLNAQSKGRMLGIFGPPKGPEKGSTPKKVGLGEDFWIEICERGVPVKSTDDGIRAVVKDKPIDPAKVETYLQSKFGADLEAVLLAMTDLATSLQPEDLASRSYTLYERFRPNIPPGQRGWGAKGELDLKLIRSLGDDA